MSTETQPLTPLQLQAHAEFRVRLTTPGISPEDKALITALAQYYDERGAQAELRMYNWLEDPYEFPWISRVSMAVRNQPGYDFKLYLQPTHPVSKLLNKRVLYVDAKSSLHGVNSYFHRHVVQTGLAEWESNPCLVITAAPEWTLDDMRAQLVTQLLVVAGLYNHPDKYQQLLRHLSSAQQDAFLTELTETELYTHQVLLQYYKRVSSHS